jgi:alcohol dehydrogenase (cytochrome c)
MIAVNISNGNLVWATPFIAEGTIFSDVKKIPDTHDWDTSWGSSISSLKYDNGTSRKVVVGHDKMGHVMAMDAATGEEIWWKTIGTTHRTYAMPSPNGSGEVWPGPQYGVEAYSAVDNDTVYAASSSMGFNYFTDRKLGGHAVPLLDSIINGVGNGTITAIDVKTGNIKWQYPTSFPTKVSPLVTNGVVFSGYFTSNGKPYTADEYGNPKITPLESSGILVAFDKDSGKKLWEFNVGAPIGVGGPSVGNGMLFVPVDRIHPPAEAGAIVAFKPILAPEKDTKKGQQTTDMAIEIAGNNTQSANVFHKGKWVLIIRIYDIFMNQQWGVVDSYVSQGYEIKSIIPASQLPNTGSAVGLFVVLEKKPR